MKALSNYSNLYCKTSGLITEASTDWRWNDFHPYLTAALKLFSINRLMYGSDWPVCLMAGTYKDTIDIIIKNLANQLNSQELQKLFGENASEFYQLVK
ncbi:amidohydrolase family protein [Alkalihalobacillus hemicellulosilyticus]|uniref:Amidohydrolase 2 n=1 Tax=Halalkalibacter hemicellulosilyticusJCM 9152 TaxID=1236971 RepID=W4QDV0_9BACI|nr:amidohydrolase family protein [Halalkalibacter hemicellulosilyticus]GAE30236.1 amidohydrolase 2 [Halalkalibacter hemicellulosilyticusJCM 9152]